jgi:hypothetical protein
MIDGAWLSSNKFDARALALYERHYSARRYADGRKRVQFVGPGEQMVLLTVCCRALFVWVRNTIERFDKQTGVNCAVFRNEGAGLSSDLVREADELAWQRWPNEPRHFTYVDASKIRPKRDPGRCFLRAGWQRAGQSKNGLVLLERVWSP